MWDNESLLRHIKSMEVFIDPECVYCGDVECFNPDCKYKEIRNFAKTALQHPDNQQYLISALEKIMTFTDFLIKE